MTRCVPSIDGFIDSLVMATLQLQTPLVMAAADLPEEDPVDGEDDEATPIDEQTEEQPAASR